MPIIKKLSTDLINKISAGEVIERPSSVVKELIDNSVDAGSTKIDIKIIGGGLEKIEVSDNGCGIEKDDLKNAFEPHATSKIENLNDLNEILTMGFRGEALSTIQSVADITIVAKYEGDEDAYSFNIIEGKPSEIKKSARDNGTTVTVNELFKRIPARLKYMKSPDTEYRKILEVLYPYFLIHPNIHFTLNKDGKTVTNLPAISGSVGSTFHPSRVKQLIKADFVDETFDFYYEGEGINIGGIMVHPKYHTSKTPWQYIFINNRPITDKGVYRSVLQGYSGYIPQGEKIPYLLNLKISPSLVDVNVHPKKSEVRFLNPYRVYQAVEEAVKSSLKKNVKLERADNSFSKVDRDEVDFSRLRGSLSGGSSSSYSSSNDSSKNDHSGFSSYSSVADSSFSDSVSLSSAHSPMPRDIDFRKKGSSEMIEESLLFSQEALKDTPDSSFRSVHQIFNKYIIVEFKDEIWVVDQHAGAERITYESLLKSRKNEIKDVQNLLTPEKIELDSITYEFVNENSAIFEEMGFSLKFSEGEIEISTIPAELVGSDVEKIFRDLLKSDSEYEIDKESKKIEHEIVASVSCHTSIRSGQKLESQRIFELLTNLMKCENPYSCPHGRPIVWKLKLSEIDKNFDRSY